MNNKKEQLGFVGLGTMGIPMVKRLLSAGYRVIGYNRTKSRAQPLLELGMQWLDSPKEVAECTDIVFTMMADRSALRAVTEGPDGILSGLRYGQIYVDMGTVEPAASRNLASKAAERGAQMLDAPVSGNALTVERGQLSFMVGGDRGVLEQVRAVFEVLGSNITYVGTHGQGSAMKIAINLSLPVQVLALCEGILLAEKNGIRREIALEAMIKSAIASPLLQSRAPFFTNIPNEALFSVSMMQKDLAIALEMGLEAGVPLHVATASGLMLTTARSMGFAHKDFAILLETLEILSGSSQ